MAEKRMTLAEAMATPPAIDRAKIAATTEADIRRHMIEDGEDPGASVRLQDWGVSVASVRLRLNMTQRVFAEALKIPLATVQNWEQRRVLPDPAARALLMILDREPAAALRALKAKAA